MAGYHVHWRFTQQDKVKNQQSPSKGNSNNNTLHNVVAQFRQKKERGRDRERSISSECVREVQDKAKGVRCVEDCELSDDMWIREIFPYHVIIHCLTHSGTKCSKRLKLQ